VRRTLVWMTLGVGGIVLGSTVGACSGLIVSETWLAVHHEHDPSADGLWCFFCAMIGGLLGCLSGFAAGMNLGYFMEKEASAGRLMRSAGRVTFRGISGGVVGALAGGAANTLLTLDATTGGILVLLGFLGGGWLGCLVGTYSLGGWQISDPLRYDVRIDADCRDRKELDHTVGALLGLDPSRARKLVDSGAPLRRGVRRAEADFLQSRFSDFGLKILIEPASRS
jgi:hypothetical protein